MLSDLIKDYKHIEFSYKPNKTRFPINKIELVDYETWNEIYMACKNELLEVEPTESGSLPYNNEVRLNSRFMVIEKPDSFELTICSTKLGCYRIILANKTPENNPVSGSEALQVVLEMAKLYGVMDIFKENRGNYKESIESPIIEVADDSYKGQEFLSHNVHHIDLNSSYASRIVEQFPRLRDLFEDLYKHRHDDNDYYKHVLTNSIGCMQSTACYDIDTVGYYKRKPYDLSYFSMIAINGTNKKLYELIYKLKSSGRKPLLYNTDGIWYEGELYHDIDEGTSLGHYKHDHWDCDLYIKSDGAYQYREGGIVHTVLRGRCKLDNEKPREKWCWREIDRDDCKVFEYKLDKDKGVIRSE